MRGSEKGDREKEKGGTGKKDRREKKRKREEERCQRAPLTLYDVLM